MHNIDPITWITVGISLLSGAHQSHVHFEFSALSSSHFVCSAIQRFVRCYCQWHCSQHCWRFWACSFLMWIFNSKWWDYSSTHNRPCAADCHEVLPYYQQAHERDCERYVKWRCQCFTDLRFMKSKVSLISIVCTPHQLSQQYSKESVWLHRLDPNMWVSRTARWWARVPDWAAKIRNCSRFIMDRKREMWTVGDAICLTIALWSPGGN